MPMPDFNKPLTVPTPAKINLFLNIRSLMADDYHEVWTILHTIGLCDTLTVSPPHAQDTDIVFSCNHTLTESPEENLVVKAYRAFFRAQGRPLFPLRVNLHKVIPAQAGLGGGSSNAAAMLSILNRLSDTPLPKERLHQTAAGLGADVPFFLEGGCVLATGRGDQITSRLPILTNLPLAVVVKNGFGIATPHAYQLVRASEAYILRSTEPFTDLLTSGPSLRKLESLLANDFESILLPHYPELADITQKMQQAGIHRPFLSGSGPSMAGFINPDQANQIRSRLESLFPAPAYTLHITTTQGQPDCLVTNSSR